MRYLNFLSCFLMLAGMGLAAQEPVHDEPHHEHPKNEIGLANHVVYLGAEQEFAYGLHLHYLRSFHESPFGVGFGYEQIFDDHGHKTLGIIGSYRPVSHLYFQLSPGITFLGPDASTRLFALHLETTYEVELGHWHLGPALGYALNREGYHISLGLHLAYGF